jgi:predicted dehydrogenase
MNRFKIAIFGCGGRITYLLNVYLSKILEQRGYSLNDINIVAIYDQNYKAVMESYKINKGMDVENLMKMIEQSKTKFYVEDEENVYKENEFDIVMIGSKNNEHYQSLILANKYNKNIFCEKPIVHKLEDVVSIKKIFEQRIKEDKLFFQTGLCLRYTKICEETTNFLHKIGKLQKIYGCEKLNVGHAGQSFMQCWRGLRSIAGGLGVEKCVHDYDLLMHFIEKGCKEKIKKIKIQSTGERKFWLPERKQEIMEKIESNDELRNAYHG